MHDIATFFIRQVDSSAEPAALVAAWLVAELGDSRHVDVRLTEPDLVTLDVTSAHGVRALIESLLSETRFAGWAQTTSAIRPP